MKYNVKYFDYKILWLVYILYLTLIKYVQKEVKIMLNYGDSYKVYTVVFCSCHIKNLESVVCDFGLKKQVE